MDSFIIKKLTAERVIKIRTYSFLKLYEATVRRLYVE